MVPTSPHLCHHTFFIPLAVDTIKKWIGDICLFPHLHIFYFDFICKTVPSGFRSKEICLPLWHLSAQIKGLCHHAICFFLFMCVPWTFSVCGGQFRALEHLELELEKLSQHMGVVVWASSCVWDARCCLSCPLFLLVLEKATDVKSVLLK